MPPNTKVESRPVPASTAFVLVPVFLASICLTLYLFRKPLGHLFHCFIVGDPPRSDLEDILLEDLGSDVESRFQRREWLAFRRRDVDEDGELRLRSPRSYFHECSEVERTLSPSRPVSRDSSSDARSDLSRELDKYFDKRGSDEAAGDRVQRIPSPSLTSPLFPNADGVLEEELLLATPLSKEVLAQASEPSKFPSFLKPPGSMGSTRHERGDGRSMRDVKTDGHPEGAQSRWDRMVSQPVDQLAEKFVGWLAKKGEDDSWRKWDEPPWKAAEA